MAFLFCLILLDLLLPFLLPDTLLRLQGHSAYVGLFLLQNAVPFILSLVNSRSTVKPFNLAALKVGDFA